MSNDTRIDGCHDADSRCVLEIAWEIARERERGPEVVDGVEPAEPTATDAEEPVFPLR